MTAKEFKNLALSFEGTIEKPHFERTAFKVINKRIFATLLDENVSANIAIANKRSGSVLRHRYRYLPGSK